MADQYKFNPFTGRLDDVGDGSVTIGTTVSGGIVNCVLFIDASGKLAEDIYFTYDSVDKLFSLSNTAYSTIADVSQFTQTFTTVRAYSGASTTLTTKGNRAVINNQDNISFTSGKSKTLTYAALSGEAVNNGRTISGSTTTTEVVASIYSFVADSPSNAITSSGTVTVNRYGTYSSFSAVDTLNNATLDFAGNYYGGSFAAQMSVTNTSSGTHSANVYGVAGSADSTGTLVPDLCIGGFFTATNGAVNYGVYASGVNAALMADGPILFTTNNVFAIGTSSIRSSNIYSVLGNFSGNVSLAAASQIDWASDVVLYRNAADELRTPDSIRVDTSVSIGTTVNTDYGLNVSKTYSTDVAHFGVAGAVTFTGSNTANNTLAGLYGNVYVNAGANTVSQAHGVFGTSLIAPGQSGTVSNAYGLRFSCHSQSTSGVTITNVYGTFSSVLAAGASVTGTAANVHGFYATSANSTSSAQIITSFYGFTVNGVVTPLGGIGTYTGVYVDAPDSNTATTIRGVHIWPATTGVSASTTIEGIKINRVTAGGAWTTQYGIRIQDLDWASTNYALYFDGTSGLSRQGIWWNADTNLYRSAANTLKTDDNLVVALECNVVGDLNHDGTNVGFYGVTPVARSSTYTASNVTTDRSYDANSTTVDELADVLGTLITDLKATGIIG